MPDVVNNIQIRSAVKFIDLVIYELEHAQSGNQQVMTAADLTRARSYLDAFTNMHAAVGALPPLDLPNSHPAEYPVPDIWDQPVLENGSLHYIGTLLRTARVELINSQSARQSTGLQIQDSERMTAIIQHLYAFLENYVENTLPLDFPDASPSQQGVLPGRSGINPR